MHNFQVLHDVKKLDILQNGGIETRRNYEL